MSDLELLSPYSMRILKQDKTQNTVGQHLYRQVDKFPEAWKPIPKGWQESGEPLPVGEYCFTTQGMYMRWQSLVKQER